MPRTIRRCVSKQPAVFLGGGGVGTLSNPTGLLTGGGGEDASKADVLDCAATPVIGQTCGDLATGGAGAAVPAAITICPDEIRDLRVGRLLSPEAKHKKGAKQIHA